MGNLDIMPTLSTEIEFLYSLQQFGVKLGLENIRKFLQHLGNPQHNLKVIHIAGSNGKGSTSSYIASIIMEAGYSVGLYTSPHFVFFNERILVDGEYIDDEYVKTFIQRHKEYIQEFKFTFFEVTTALAINFFCDNKVDYAIVETGLGGRLDATNALPSIASVITSISLEHTDVLGNTLEKIAFEKADIIKNGGKVFIGRLPIEAVDVIQNTCDERNAELFELEDYIIERDEYLEVYTEELDITTLNSPLLGEYQRRNAALAILTVYETLDIVNPHIFETGILNVVENTKIQGRFEYLNQAPDIILDSAHNPEGLEHFLTEFKKNKSQYEKTTVLFTALRDKELKTMLALMLPVFDSVIFTTLTIDRALSKDEIEAIINSISSDKIIFESNPSNVVENFMNTANKTECLVVTGSMYLLGAVKQGIDKNY